MAAYLFLLRYQFYQVIIMKYTNISPARYLVSLRPPPRRLWPEVGLVYHDVSSGEQAVMHIPNMRGIN